MADDPQNPTPRPSDEARDDAEGTPTPRGLGRFASRFRRGQGEPSQDAPQAEDPEVLDEPDPLADRPSLLNLPDVDWSAPPMRRPGEDDTTRAVEPQGPEGPSGDVVQDRSGDDATPSPLAVAAVELPPDVPPAAPVATAAPLPSLDPIARVEAAEPRRTEATSDGPRTRPAGISAHLAVLTGVATAVILAFLLIEPSPRWLLLLGAAAVVVGLDGTLRQTWRAPFSLGQETAPFLFAPALYMLAVPVLIEHNVSGELALLVGLGAGLGFGGLAWAEVASVRTQAAEYEQARIVVTANTYLAGFAIFSLSYVFDIGLPAAIIATSIAASMLAVEILREGEIDPMETLGLSLVAGVVVGEFRWLLYYVPLDTYLAGLTLLLVFYLATGLLHSHVIRALNRVIALEYGGIAAAGLALVVVARASGLA